MSLFYVHRGNFCSIFSHWSFFGSKHGLMLAKLWIFIKQIIFKNFSKFLKLAFSAFIAVFYNNSEKELQAIIFNLHYSKKSIEFCIEK